MSRIPQEAEANQFGGAVAQAKSYAAKAIDGLLKDDQRAVIAWLVDVYAIKNDMSAEAQKPESRQGGIIDEASRVITERAAQHGDSHSVHERAARLWSALLHTHVTAQQVALCMGHQERHVGGSSEATERAAQHGDSHSVHERAARLWSALLHTHVTAQQVALCMVALKLARAIESPENRDHYVDACGYLELAWREIESGGAMIGMASDIPAKAGGNT